MALGKLIFFLFDFLEVGFLVINRMIEVEDGV